MNLYTLFFVIENGNKRTIYRKNVSPNLAHPLEQNYKLAAQSDQIVIMTPTGRGRTIKNRYSAKPQYFSREQMVMLALQAEPT